MWSRPKVPIILQTEIADCGLACLAMILCYFKRMVDLPALRRLFPPALTGTSIAKLRRMAEHYQLSSTVYRVEPSGLPGLQLPLIAFWENNHFVVLTAIDRHRVLIHDPRFGRVGITVDELSAKFSGYVVQLTPAAGFMPGSERLVRWRDALGGVVQILKTQLAKILLLTLGLEILSLATPYYSKIVVDRYIASPGRPLLPALTVAFAVLVILRSIGGLIRSQLVIKVRAEISYAFTEKLLRHTLRLPLSLLARRHVGDIFSRVTGGEALRNCLTTHVVEAAVNSLLVVGCLILMFYYSSSLALLTVGAMVAVAAACGCLLSYQSMTARKIIIDKAEEQGAVLDTIRNIHAIKVFGCEARRIRAWSHLAHIRLGDEMSLDAYTARYSCLATLVFGLSTVGTIYLSVHRVVIGELTIGMLVAFIAYQAQVVLLTGELMGSATEFVSLKSSLERIGDTLCEDVERTETELTGDAARFAGSVSLEGVGYVLPEQETWLFRHVRLEVGAGEKIAIVGPTGIGKSTLARVVLGLICPTEGRSLIDGVPVSRVPRGVVLAVTHADRLLKGTIAQNVSFFDENIDMERVRGSLGAVGLLKYVESLPLRYHTIIAELSPLLSDGQRQLLLVARALYFAPKVLVLDEATSCLDLATEDQILETLSALKVTQILITHRLSSVRGRYVVHRFDTLQGVEGVSQTDAMLLTS